MSPLLTAVFCLVMIGTSLLSGIFGMAGGMILIGVLLVLMPVPEAMMLHGVTQMASNGWRGLLWIKHVRWSAIGAYLAGCASRWSLWSFWRYVPGKAVALLLLGLRHSWCGWCRRTTGRIPKASCRARSTAWPA